MGQTPSRIERTMVAEPDNNETTSALRDLIEHLKEEGASYAEISEAAGVSYQSIFRMRKGEVATLDTENLVQLCEHFDLPLIPHLWQNLLASLSPDKREAVDTALRHEDPVSVMRQLRMNDPQPVVEFYQLIRLPTTEFEAVQQLSDEAFIRTLLNVCQRETSLEPLFQPLPKHIYAQIERHALVDPFSGVLFSLPFAILEFDVTERHKPTSGAYLLVQTDEEPASVRLYRRGYRGDMLVEYFYACDGSGDVSVKHFRPEYDPPPEQQRLIFGELTRTVHHRPPQPSDF